MKNQIDYQGRLHCVARHPSGKNLETDAPKDNGGRGEAFSPTDLFALSLGSCMMTVMALAAEKMGVDLTGSTVEVEKEMALAPRRIGKIGVLIKCPIAPDQRVREKLEKVALDCPVHHSLSPEIKLEFQFSWGDSTPAEKGQQNP